MNFREEDDFNFLLELMRKANSQRKKTKYSNKIQGYSSTAEYKGKKITVFLYSKMPKWWEDVIIDLHLSGGKITGEFYNKKYTLTIPFYEYQTEMIFSDYYAITTALVFIEDEKIKLMSNICSISTFTDINKYNQKVQVINHESNII